MKYSPLIVALAALFPALAHAQSPQFSDCRTIEAAGNFVGSDEALVNGLVCKVSKPKTNWTSTAQTPGKSAEGSLALLGILTPETLRSKEKTGAKTGTESTPATPGPAQSNSAAGERPQKSLGDIAREYRKEASARILAEPEQGFPEAKKPGAERVDRAAIVPRNDKAAMVTSVTQPLPTATPALSSVAGSPATATKVGNVSTAPDVLPSAPTAALGAAKTEVIAVPQIQANPLAQKTNPEAPTPLPSQSVVKQEASLPAVQAKSASASDVQRPVQAPIPASGQKTPLNEIAVTSPTPSPAAGAHESKPELLSNVGSISAPPPSSTNASPEFEANNNEEDAAFREGQGPTCRKNISLGSMDKDKLFLAIPVWALGWLEKNQKRFPGICFSDSLMFGAKNYLVVFYMAAPPAVGSTSLRNTSAPGETTPANGMGSFTASYGSTWHYTYERTVTTTITSASAEKAPHKQLSRLLYATAYSEQGIPVSHHSPAGVAKQVKQTSYKPGKKDDAELAEFRRCEELLEKMIKDMAKL